jgi:PilZ domain
MLLFSLPLRLEHARWDMTSESDGRERRKRPRVPLQKGEVSGRIHTFSGAPLVDISENGALIEIAASLRPGTVYVMRLSFGAELHLNLRTRVVRTYVHAFQSNEKGESVVSYRAALEFVEMSDAERDVLRAHIDSIQNVDMEFE